MLPGALLIHFGRGHCPVLGPNAHAVLKVCRGGDVDLGRVQLGLGLGLGLELGLGLGCRPRSRPP